VPPIFLERRELGEDVRRLLDRLIEGLTPRDTPVECSPPCDVLETPDTIEIIMDLPGVALEAVTVILARQTIVIAGRKEPTACGHTEAAFHLAERTFGRFVRPVQVGGAIDASRAEATLSGGELRVRIPRIEERRGREIRIPIKAE
jgi:HSP20 family protein